MIHDHLLTHLLVAMPARRNIFLNLLRLAVILVGAALVAPWRLIMPAVGITTTWPPFVMATSVLDIGTPLA